MSTAFSRQEAEAIASDDSYPGPMPAAARGRAYSVPQPGVFPQEPLGGAFTQSDVGGWFSSVAAGHHMTGHHPSLAEARRRHHEAAARWDSWPMITGRLAWGYGVHLSAKSVLMLIEWMLETPLRFFAIVFVAGLAYFLCGGRFW